MKVAALALLASAAWSATTPTGPAVGAKAPVFELRDQDGVAHTLSSLLGPKGAIVVFYRSADW